MRIGNLVVALAAILALAAGHATARSAAHFADGTARQSGVPAASSASYQLDWAAAGAAAGDIGASANYRLSASIGQAAADTASESSGFRLCLGAQCPPAFQSAFVPVVTR